MRHLSRAMPLVVGILVGAAWIVVALRWQARERDVAEPARLAPRREAAKEPARPAVVKPGAPRTPEELAAATKPRGTGRYDVSALPGGYVKCRRGGSETQTLTGGGDMKVWYSPSQVNGDFTYFWLYFQGAITLEEFLSYMTLSSDRNTAEIAGVSLTVYSTYVGVAWMEVYQRQWMVAVVTGPGGTVEEVERRYWETPGSVPSGGAYSRTVHVDWSFGPVFLGSKFTCPTPEAGGPAFSYRDGTLQHSWFADENTQLTTSWSVVE